VRSYGVTCRSPPPPADHVRLYFPKGTYDSIFLANYANINITTDDPDQRDRQRHRCFGAAPVRHAVSVMGDPDQLSKLNITIRRSSTHQCPEQGESRRPDRRPAGAHGTGIHLRVGPGAAPDAEEEFGQIVVRANPEAPSSA